MTAFINKLLSLHFFKKPQTENFFGMSVSEKKQLFKKVIREANREQIEMINRHPQQFKSLEKKIIK